MSGYIVEMRHITKRFPGVVANNDISIAVKRGEIYAILGENGAGKSTLMSMLFGMYEPDEGEIYIRGEKVRITSPAFATRLNIGMVHQHFKLVSNYTITENIILGEEPEKKAAGFLPYVDVKGSNRKIAELSKRYGLKVDPTKRIDEVNVSVQQRVEILKMLYRESEILIFDEPTAVLTPQEIQFLLDIIKELRKGGKTVILISHKLEEIKQVADRCAILCRGKLIDVLPVAETSTRKMANLMVGREVDFTLAKSSLAMGAEVLRLENLVVKNRHGFPIVDDVSFAVHEGEIFAVAGVSGNGQTELADAIAGMRDVSSGKIFLKGKDITYKTIRERTRSGISYIPEDRQKVGLILDYTLGDNLSLKNYYTEPFCKNSLLAKKEFIKYGTKLSKKYDIRAGQGVKTVVRYMSGGNQQKAILAREIELGSKLMIFVQPTRGLDIGAIENVHRQILEEREKGKAVLLISLELDEIMDLADTIAVIYRGKILKTAPASELTGNKVGEYMMGVREHE